MRDKDVQGILDALLPRVSSVIATAAPTPRAMPAERSRTHARGAIRPADVRVKPDAARAIELALG